MPQCSSAGQAGRNVDWSNCSTKRVERWSDRSGTAVVLTSLVEFGVPSRIAATAKKVEQHVSRRWRAAVVGWFRGGKLINFASYCDALRLLLAVCGGISDNAAQTPDGPVCIHQLHLALCGLTGLPYSGPCYEMVPSVYLSFTSGDRS